MPSRRDRSTVDLRTERIARERAREVFAAERLAIRAVRRPMSSPNEAARYTRDRGFETFVVDPRLSPQAIRFAAEACLSRAGEHLVVTVTIPREELPTR